PAKKWIQKISTFSYLVLFFGIFSLATVIIVNRRTVFPIRSFHISYKVQAVLIGMVVGTFVIFAVVAIENVTRQYNANTTDNLKEKINSVETVVGQQIGSRENLTIHADYMNYTLKRL